MSASHPHTTQSDPAQGPLGLAGRQRLIAAAVEAGLRAAAETLPTVSARAELGEHLQQQATVACTAVLRGRAADPEQLEFVQPLARQWALDEIPLAPLLQAYRAAESAIWDWLCSSRLGLPPGAQIATGRVVSDCFDAASRIATASYLETHGPRPPERTSDEWVTRLITGERVRDLELARGLAQHGLDRDRPLIVFAVDFGRPIDDTTLVSFALELDGPPPLVGRFNRRCIGIVSGEDPDAIVAALAEPCGCAHAGISTARVGLAEIPAAYAEARRALRMTTRDRPRLAFGRATLLDDLLSLADRTTARLIPVWASALDDEDRRSGGELLATLRAYTDADLNVAAAAKHLGVHPNTVRYRLHRIEAVTGRSVKSFHGVFEMLASLSLLRGDPITA